MEHFLEQCNSATSHFANSGRRLPTHGCEPYDCTPRGAPLKGSSYSVAEPPRNLGGTVARASFSRVQCCTIDPSPPLRIPLPSESSPPEGTGVYITRNKPCGLGKFLFTPLVYITLPRLRLSEAKGCEAKGCEAKGCEAKGCEATRAEGDKTGWG